MAGIDERAASVVILEAHFDRSCLGDFMGVKQYEPKTGIHSKRMVTSHNRVETLIGHERWRTKARAAPVVRRAFPGAGRRAIGRLARRFISRAKSDAIV
jgi:hypothetical protein